MTFGFVWMGRRAGWLGCVMALFLAHSCLRLSAQTAWKTDSVLVFLHRSACMAAPENTVPALERAVKQGADGIEVDIRRTRDGVLILYHDDWVLRQRGTTGKIEAMTFAETMELDVGERFGPQWSGLTPPLYDDVLRFAHANNLRLYLDIKTPGIYAEVLEVTKRLDCMELVHTTGGQVPPDNLKSSIPWIQGWNYTEGGEEDPERMRALLTPTPTTPVGIMCDDARSIVRALGRRPELRPFVPFRTTKWTRLNAIVHANGMRGVAGPPRRSSCVTLPVSTLLKQAESDPNFVVRQHACWRLGDRKDSSASAVLLRIALRPLDAAKQEAGNYEDTFLKIAAACALARLQSKQGRDALRRLADSKGEFDREAVAFALSAFGTEKDVPMLCELADGNVRNNGTVASVVVSGVGRLGAKTLPIYRAALEREDVSKFTVFGLAALGEKALPLLESYVMDTGRLLPSRRRAALALAWMELPAARRLRDRLLSRSDLPDELYRALK